MILQLDMNSTTPIYVQLRNQIVLGIGNGQFQRGDRLPPVRTLAQDIGVNVMTVNKTYAILKAEGFIEIDRRHGAKVCVNPAKSPEFHDKLESDLSLLLVEAQLKGYEETELVALCNDILKRYAAVQ